MFDLGMQELIVIFIVALLVFGPKRLPELGRTIGKGLGELKKAMEGIREQVHSEYEMEQKSDESRPELEDKKVGAEAERSPAEAEQIDAAAEPLSGEKRKEDTVDGR